MGGVHLATKINITFFVGIDVLNIFNLTTFSKEKTIFSKITAKNYFWGRDHFWGNWVSDHKNKYNFSCVEIVYQIQFLKFFLKNPHNVWLKPKKLVLGTFFPASVVLWGQLFPKTIGFTHEWIRTNHMNFKKIGSKRDLCNFL